MEFQPVIPIWVGYDYREAAAYHTFQQSIIDRSSRPVTFGALHGPMLDNFDGQQDGTNKFIYSRFLVPALQRYDGWAIFCDGDMVVEADIAALWDLREDDKAAMVVKHDYETKTFSKLKGTPIAAKNEHYPRKNWSSVIMWNCGHPKNKILTKDFVAEAGGKFLHRFEWLDDEDIGEIPQEWNHLVGEYPHLPSNLYHYTLGAPGFFHYHRDGDEWHKAFLRSIHMIGEDPESMVRRAKHYAII